MAPRRSGNGVGNRSGLALVLALATVLLMVTSACAPALRIAAPVMVLPPAYDAAPTGSADLDQWSRRMDDPQLATLVERGLATGRDVTRAPRAVASCGAAPAISRSTLRATLPLPCRSPSTGFSAPCAGFPAAPR